MSRFRLPAVALGLVFLGVCSCGGSSEGRGTSKGGSSGTGGTASGGAGASSGGSEATGGDAGLGGASGDAGAGIGGRAGAGGAAGAGGSGGGAGGTSGAGGLGGNAGASGAGGSGGAGAVSYTGCGFGSGVARHVVAKRDPARDRCVVLILSQPGSDTFGLTLPMAWGVESAFFSTPAAADCVMRLPSTGGVSAESGTGTVTRTIAFSLDVDVTLRFPGNVTEQLEAIGLDTSSRCSL